MAPGLKMPPGQRTSPNPRTRGPGPTGGRAGHGRETLGGHGSPVIRLYDAGMFLLVSGASGAGKSTARRLSRATSSPGWSASSYTTWCRCRGLRRSHGVSGPPRRWCAMRSSSRRTVGMCCWPETRSRPARCWPRRRLTDLTASPSACLTSTETLRQPGWWRGATIHVARAPRGVRRLDARARGRPPPSTRGAAERRLGADALGTIDPAGRDGQLGDAGARYLKLDGRCGGDRAPRLVPYCARRTGSIDARTALTTGA